MARRGWRWAALALVAASSASPARAGDGRGPSSIRWEEGSRAPADTWLQEDGCPARTGATESEPLTGPREPAWKFDVAGEVEGEPVVWRGKTFVVERTGAKRVLHVLASATGVERYKQAFDTPLPLAPCVQEGRIVLRTSPRTVQGFAVGEKSMASRWTLTAKTAIGPPVLVRNEVYVVVDGVLERRTYGAKDPVWPKAGAAGVRVTATGAGAPAGKGPAPESPRPSVRGGSVFFASGHRLVEVDRQDGTFRREGRIEGEVDARASRVVVGFGDVLVACGSAFPDGDREVNTARFGRADAGAFEVRRGLSAPNGMASVGRDWVGVIGKGASATALVLLAGASRETGDATELATAAVHAEYLESRAPPSTAGDVVFVGGRAFDAGSLDVLRPEALPSVSRTIPLRDRLLVVETTKRVAAWRSTKKPAEAPPLRLLGGDPAAPSPVPAAHAVVEDGRVVAGGFVLDAKAATLRGTGKPGDAGAWPLAGVAALVTDDAPRRLVLAARPEDAATAVAAIARAAVGADLVALVAEAVAAGDADLAARVLTAAGERAAPEADLAAAAKALAALETRPAARAEEKAAEVEARLAALLARETDAMVEIASSLPADAPLAYAIALVRAVVERAPFHAGATAWVSSHLPAGLEPRGFQDLGDWLDFLDIHATGSLRVLGPKAKAPEGVPAAVTAALATARAKWRDDLVGFQNGPLLVVSPPERPGAIARCLTLGRVVSDALDAAFQSMGPPRTENEILVLHLFSNQGDYLAQSRGSGDEGEPGFGGLEHTAGHFSPSANVTRIFFPTASRRDDSVAGTYAHELTHHWIARRRPPRPGEEAISDRAGGPGYFVVEGFADFVKDFGYDVATGKAEPLNARAGYADVVAGLPDAAAFPWSGILSMPQREAYANLAEGDVKIPLRWRMGTEGRFSKGNIYYAQAAAATAYLFLAEDGKYRPALLTFLYDHYAGSSDPGALLTSLGIGADELGARIVRWCRSLGAPPKAAPPKGGRPK